ncbi:MAG TPA: hypothetical protein VFX16_18775 [Pseudonocardiaceae bacterium]|nr:hypothetical protein [Pseudonocardiaceae bacterium]
MKARVGNAARLRKLFLVSTVRGGRYRFATRELRRCVFGALVLSLTAGCTTSTAAPAPTSTPKATAGALGGARRSSVVTYASAPKAVQTVLDHTGLEPVVETTGAKLAVGHHVVVAGDVDPSDLSAMAQVGDDAVDEVDQLTGLSVHGRVLILAPATEAEYLAWGGAGFTDAWGITRYLAWKGAQTWITLNLATGGLDAGTLKADQPLLVHVIDHEMFHALTLKPSGRGKAPLWLTEGFAALAGQQQATVWPRTPPTRVTLPTDTQVRTDTYGYFLAWQFVVFVERRVGQARAMRFYFAAVSPRRHSTLNALSNRYLKASLATLASRWKHAYRKHGPIGI